jgi:kynureninase
MSLLADESHALKLDAADPQAEWREHFFIPENQVYLDGNSLGLLSREAEAALLKMLGQWKNLAIDGWLRADPPWFTLGEELGALMASLIGAAPGEVVATGSTTVNLHALLATFYRPAGKRTKIVATALDFSSDRYALESQIALRGLDPKAELRCVASRDGRLVEEGEIIAAMTDDVALVFLPAVSYQSGQLFDMARLTAAAHERGILIGFDCAHSIGAVEHAFDEWGVDFALWCTYKYLNSGPGGIGGLYVNRRHFPQASGMLPGLRGWWGSDKSRQFDLAPEFTPAGCAGAWQIGTTHLFSAAPLLGSLRIFKAVGIGALRAKSQSLTGYLIELLDELAGPPWHLAIGSPREPARRGGHVAVEHPDAARLCKALKARGVIPDFRPPNVIRLAPAPLYNSFHEVWRTANHMKEIIEHGEQERHIPGRDVVA